MLILFSRVIDWRKSDTFWVPDTGCCMQRNPLAAISLLEFLCESEVEHVSQKKILLTSVDTALCTERFVVINRVNKREDNGEKPGNESFTTTSLTPDV